MSKKTLLKKIMNVLFVSLITVSTFQLPISATETNVNTSNTTENNDTTTAQEEQKTEAVASDEQTVEASTEQSEPIIVQEPVAESPLARTTQVNGGVSLNIPTYDGVGWQNGEVKDVEVVVDFKDATTAGKKLEITIPEGMRIEAVSVIPSVDKTGVDASILANYESSDPLYTAITKMEVPKKEIPAMGATFGSIKYEFTNGTQKATIRVKVSVDMARYYGAHTVPNPINAIAYKGTNPVQEVGDSSQIIKGIGDAVLKDFQLNRGFVNGTEKILVSSENNISKGFTHKLTLDLYNSGALSKIKGVYVKEVIYTGYYPVGAELIGTTASGGFTTVSNDATIGKATFERKGWTGELHSQMAVNYSLPLGVGAGRLDTTAKDQAIVTWYDGTKTTLISTYTQYAVDVVSEVVNGLKFTENRNFETESIENHQSQGPGFILKNLSGGMVTEQIFEAKIDENYQASTILFPFDNTIVGNEIKDIYYKTNKNPTDRKYTVNTATIKKVTNTIAYIGNQELNLEQDEFITSFKANVGSFSANYVSSNNSGDNPGRLSVYGGITKGSTQASVSFSMYDAEKKDETITTGVAIVKEVTTTRKNFASGATATVTPAAIVAGESFEVKATIAGQEWFSTYATTQAMENPEIYLREVDGHNIVLSTIEIKDSSGVNVEYTFVEQENYLGEKVLKLKTKNTTVGTHFGTSFANRQNKKITVSYKVITDVKSTGEYEINDMVSFGKPGVEVKSVANYPGIVDKYDLNGNGDVNEILQFVSANKINIQANKNVLVETFLSLEGEEPKGPYVDGDLDTLAYFTPGTNANYTLNITNNGDAAADAMTTYVPIPKAGASFGEQFQSEAFKWNMTLSKAIVAPAGYEAQYSTNATEANFNTTATYSTTVPATLKDVKMVKLVATAAIQPGAKATVSVPLKVDETFTTATSGNKIGTRDIFNPVYVVDSTAFKGQLKGTLAGTELVIAQIGGLVFEDKNADGIYKAADNDALIANHEVHLYKYNTQTQVYDAVLDSSLNPVKVKTNAQGVYLFDYTTNLGYGKYAVKFVEKTPGTYQYTINTQGNPTIDSDAIISGNDKGWVLGIDATKPQAMNIGAGFLAYNPPVDLKATINPTPNSVKVGSTILVGSTVTPTFFPTIKADTDAYTWEIVGNAANKAKATLVNNDNGTVTIIPNALASGTTTFNVQLTITDTYGNQATSNQVTITVISNTPPTIIAPEVKAYVGDTMNLNTNVSAKDNTNQSITLVGTGAGQNYTVTQAIPVVANKFTTAGTYKVTYGVTDKYGNIGTKDVLFKVSGTPSVVATPQQYVIGTASIASSVAENAVATWQNAAETAGSAPISTSIPGPANLIGGNNTIKYEVTGPSNNFSVLGVYTVKYTATNPDGKTGEQTVTVSIKSANQTIDGTNTIGLDADNFTLTNSDAKNITDTLAKDVTHANVSATKTIRNASNVIESYQDITNKITVDTTQLAAIKATTVTGGIYNLTFKVTDGAITVTKVVKVVVNGSSVVESNGITLSAQDFTLPNNQAASLSEAIANTKAKPLAIDTLTGQEIATVTANSTQLAAIKSATAAGGIYDLTYTATHNSKTATKTIKVTVEGASVVQSNNITLSAQNAAIPYAQAATYTEALAVADSKAKAIVTATGAPIYTITVNQTQLSAIKGAPLTGGAYPLDITATYGGKTAMKTVIIVVTGTNTVIKDSIAISANTFTSTEANAKALTEAKAIVAAEAKAIDLVTGQPLTAIKTTASEINAIKAVTATGGIYPITFSVTQNTTVATITISAIVEGASISIANNIALSAKDFTLENADAINLTEASAKINANTKAVNTITGANVTAITVDAAQLTAIKSSTSAGGIYDLKVTATEDGKSVSRTIKVTVKGTSIITANNITLSAFDFTLENGSAAGLTEATALTNAKAKAIDTTTGEVLTNLTVDATQLSTITKVQSTGGVFSLKVTAKNSTNKTVTKEIKVTVKGSDVVVENGITLAANNFTVEQSDATTLTQDLAIINANASAFVTATSTPITALTVNTAQLATIKTATAKGGIYPLQVIATNGSNSATKTITVTVKGTNVTVENGILLSAYGFTIANNEAASLTDTLAKTKAQLVAKDEFTGSTIDTVSVNATQLAEIKAATTKGGIFDLTFTATQDGKTAVLSVKVVVEGSGVVTENGIVVQAYDFILNNQDAATLTAETATTHAVAKAIETEFGTVISPVEVNAVELAGIKTTTTTGGLYDLTFNATYDGMTASKTIKVLVQPKGAIITNNIMLHANNITSKIGQVDTMSNAEIITAANMRAIDTITHENIEITDIVKTPSVNGPNVITFKTITGESFAIYNLASNKSVKVFNAAGTEAITKIKTAAVVPNQLPLNTEKYNEIYQVEKWTLEALNSGQGRSQQTYNFGDINFDKIREETGVYPIELDLGEGLMDVSYAFVTEESTMISKAEDVAAGEAIFAENFSLTVEEAANLTDEIINEKAGYPATVSTPDVKQTLKAIKMYEYDMSGHNVIVPHTIDRAQIMTVPGVYPVTFTSENGVAITVYARVYDETNPPVIETAFDTSPESLKVVSATINLFSQNITFAAENVATKTEADIPTVAYTTAFTRTGSYEENILTENQNVSMVDTLNFNPEQMTKLKTAPKNGGLFTIYVNAEAVTNGHEQSVTKAITVFVKPTNLIENEINKEGITATGFTIPKSELETANFVELAKAKAYDLTDETNISEVAVTLKGDKPTTAGLHAITFTTAKGTETTVNVLVKPTNVIVHPENKEAITATGFSINLTDVEAANFVELAEAKAYDLTDETNISEVAVTLKGDKPTTAGLHAITFTTAKGTETTVNVLVKPTNVIVNPENKEAITATGFSINLTDVEAANFVELAEAKAYDLTDETNISEVAVTLKGDKPTTAGLHAITFTTAKGTETTVNMLVKPTNVIIDPENKEAITATGFSINLTDVEAADFVELSEAKAYDVSDISNITEVDVTLKSEKPTIAGVYDITFTTIKGTETTVVATIKNREYIEITASDVHMTLSELKKAVKENTVEETITTKANIEAVFYNEDGIKSDIIPTITINTEALIEAQNIEEKTIEITATIVKGEDSLALRDNQITPEAVETITETKIITVVITEDTGGEKLPATGQAKIETLLFALLLILVSSLIFVIKMTRRQIKE